MDFDVIQGIMLLCAYVGFWDSIDDIKKSRSIDRTFIPNLSDEVRSEKIRMWKKAVKYAFGWAKED